MNNDHVILNVHIDAAGGQEEKLAEQLRALVAPTRAKLDAWRTNCTAILRIPAGSCFASGSRSQAALDEHLASPHFKSFVAYRAAGNPDPVASIVITTWRAIA